jgi:hypothetical protein
VSRRDSRRRANKVHTLEYFVPYRLLGQRWNGYRIPIVIQLGSNRYYKAVLV